ncbi:MAG: single-stranded DNA-binding protein [Ferrimicrobium sp.]
MESHPYFANDRALIGRLVATPELRETGSGQLASFACSYLGKAGFVYIERLQSRQWKATDGSA